MAALSDAPIPRVVDLRRIRAADLEPVLQEEADRWDRELHWDFGPAGELVRRFTGMRALNGCALYEGGACIGYGYYVTEDHKGLIGDLYVRRARQSIENENLLLGTMLEELFRTPYIRRVESQLMMLQSPLDRPVPMAERMESFERHFLEIDLEHAAGLPERRGALRYAGWDERRQDDSAQLIAEAYRGHVDGRINDQYRSPAGARRFLMNIIQYPGCGHFLRDASYAAYDDELAGVSLASVVGPTAGHITQICVAPRVRGSGAGYELLRRSLESMRQRGCRTASLTVTAANTEAVRLYRAAGFRTLRDFSARIWDVGNGSISVPGK